MRPYNKALKGLARDLRNEMTDAERVLWARLRRKQVGGVQFYRQKPLGNFVVDFYAPKARLAIEVDGSQHFEEDHAERDRQRDEYLRQMGIEVSRFSNLEVLRKLDTVVAEISRVVGERWPTGAKSPLGPPFD